MDKAISNQEEPEAFLLALAPCFDQLPLLIAVSVMYYMILTTFSQCLKAVGCQNICSHTMLAGSHVTALWIVPGWVTD